MMEQQKLKYDIAMQAVRAEMGLALKNAPAILSDITESLRLATGKGIRGDLAVLSSCDDNCESNLPAVKIAAAIELLHLATLVHDDVIDNAKTRRGKPSLYRQFGTKNAIITGDYLFCLCFNLISQAYSHYSGEQYIERISDFSRAMSYICLGEIKQHKHSFDFNLSVKDYLKIINGKTTALFTMSLYSGARAGNMTHDQARIYGNIGRSIGSIFQLIDDCLDYEMNLAVANKPIAQDLAAGVITLPLIYAMGQDPAFRDLVRSVPAHGQDPAKPELYQEIAVKVQSLGGIEYTKMIAMRYYNKALHMIDRIESPFKQEKLCGILENVYSRKV